MSPKLSIQNSCDCLLGNAEFSSERNTAKTGNFFSVAGSYFEDLGFRKLGHWGFLAARLFFGNRFAVALSSRLAKLNHFVSHVIGVGSQKEVRWVHTCTVVALVANEQSVWDFSYAQFVCQSVNVMGFSGNGKSPVSTPELCRRPNPAPFWMRRFINLFPKPFNLLFSHKEIII